MPPLINNILALIFLQGASYLLPLITLPFLVRTLGIEAFGKLSFGLAVIQYFVILTDYGFNLSATRAIARIQGDKAAISAICWNVTACKLLLACIGLAILTISSECFLSLKEIRPVLLAAYLLVAGSLLFPIWLFQGMESMWHISVASVLSKALTIPAIFVFVSGPDDSWIAALIHGLASVTAGVIAIIILFRLGWIQWSPPTVTQMRRQLTDGWHIFVSTGAIALYTATTTTLLGILAGYSAVGHFAAADKIRQAVQSLVTPVSQALYPRISALISQHKPAAFMLIRKQLFWQGLGTLILALGVGLFAPEIVRLAYGEGHYDTISLLRILSPLPFIVGLSNVLGIQTMLPLGMNKTFSRILLLSGLANIVMIFPLASNFAAYGAATAVLVTESLVTLMMGAVLLRSETPIFKREKIATP